MRQNQKRCILQRTIWVVKNGQIYSYESIQVTDKINII